jgi:hypothetical protein
MSTPDGAPVRASEGGRPEMDDKPPILGSWRNIYALVIGTLVVIIIVGALITRAYA